MEELNAKRSQADRSRIGDLELELQDMRKRDALSPQLSASCFATRPALYRPPNRRNTKSLKNQKTKSTEEIVHKGIFPETEFPK
eukprot:4586783-Amphidinium_carterae.1